MKRLLIALAATAFVSAHAADVAPAKAAAPAKTAPKKAAAPAAAPAVAAKPKEPVLTRDELRACMDLFDANEASSKALVAEFADYKAGNDKLKAEQAVILKDVAEMDARVTAIKAELEARTKANEEFKITGPKMEKADFDAKVKELTALADAFNASRDKAVADEKVLTARRVAFSAEVDKSNALGKSLEDRRDAQLDKEDEYKNQCYKKKYDEADEKAIKKERAAAAAAPK